MLELPKILTSSSALISTMLLLNLMKHGERSFDLYVLTALSKGFPVFCSILLPILYVENIINVEAIGYIGAVFIAMTIIGALLVSKWLHQQDTRTMLRVASVGVISASVVILVAINFGSIALLTIAYGLMGVAAGMALSGVNALTAAMTTRGARFKTIANLSMVADLVRVLFALAVTGLVALDLIAIAAVLITIMGLVFLFYVSRQPPYEIETIPIINLSTFRRNGKFKFIMSLEFLDSFSSSQLFIFLPLLFLAKGYSIESSLLLQTVTFIGYMSGRWAIGVFAQRYSGLRAVGFSEVGMVVSIVLLLLVNSLLFLYVLTFALGFFARGTSPAIKALAFDSLNDNQVKQGSAVQVIVGDSGSALGQLVFGILVATYSANSPFILATVIASLITILCTPKVYHFFK